MNDPAQIQVTPNAREGEIIHRARNMSPDSRKVAASYRGADSK
jgi:hypothetical protein